MLYIVQSVMWGVAETPQLFVEEEKAQTAYVECVKVHWAQRYSAYCDHHGLNSDAFASAQGFVGTIDLSEKSHVHYWTFDADAIGFGDAKKPLGGGELEELRTVARDMVSVKAGLTGVLEDLSELSGRFSRLGLAPEEVQTAEEPETTAAVPSTCPREMPELDPETYTTPEWKDFVGIVMRLASGGRNEFSMLPREAWRDDIYSSRTSLEYWDWAADRLVKYKEWAQSCNFSVFEDPASPGCYKFRTPKGIASENCCDSEWEAWCAAGLDLEASRGDAEG